MITYQETLNYLDSFVNYEETVSYRYKSSLRLDRTRALLSLLNNPQDKGNFIHIAGTKGKGSVAGMAASILTATGKKTGLYTSPHLVDFRERIKIDGKMIEEGELAEIVEEIKPAIRLMEEKPSFFEVYTAAAFCYFAKKKTDFTVLEVGLGGRLDATNVVKPKICAITPISYDHTDKLGDTLREIAAEKAGIIKEGAICISGPQEEKTAEVIREVCRDKGVTLFEVGKDIQCVQESFSDYEQTFSVETRLRKYPYLKMQLLGDHQLINASMAVGIIEALDIDITQKAIEKGLWNVNWAGRLEVIKRRPYIVLDGAQNRASGRALREAIRKFFKFNRLFLILGICQDKDIKGICEELVPPADKLIITKFSNPRAASCDQIKDLARLSKRDSENIAVSNNIQEALSLAQSQAAKDDLILITGSLFLVGEAKEFIDSHKL